MMEHKVRTRSNVKVAPEKPVARSECRHYWIIESANGPYSSGMCKLCGAEKEFQNFLPYSVWEGNLPTLFDIDSIKDIKIAAIDAEEVDNS